MKVVEGPEVIFKTASGEPFESLTGSTKAARDADCRAVWLMRASHW